jgi:hypothetical protein
MENSKSLLAAQKLANAISLRDAVKCTINMETLDEKSFDLDINGVEYEGGSYIIDNGNIINISLPKPKIYGTIYSSVEQIIKSL